MKNLTRQLKKRRRLLLQRYDDEDLHQLRIGLRRMRGSLKQVPGKQAKRLRRELGVLASITNAARDWDTLTEHAAQLLPTAQYRHLQPRFELHQQAAHEKVLRMLQSDDWKTTVKHWQRLEEEQGLVETAATGDKKQRQAALPLKKVISARDKALGKGGDRRWHKLRIAIKDLRYHLDETPKKKRSAGAMQIIALCKELQEYLGAWHDTVIHRQLLAEMVDSIDPVNQPLVADALDILTASIEEEGDALLDQVKTVLQQQETQLVLSPVAEGVR